MTMTRKHRSTVQCASGKCSEMWYRIEAQNVSHTEGGASGDNDESSNNKSTSSVASSSLWSSLFRLLDVDGDNSAMLGGVYEPNVEKRQSE
jgi:hypothetical protein